MSLKELELGDSTAFLYAHILCIYYIFDGYDVGICTSLYTTALFTSFMYLDVI